MKAQSYRAIAQRVSRAIMPQFRVAAGARSAGSAAATASLGSQGIMKLSEVAALEREPVSTIATIGRVVFMYAVNDRFPNIKFVLGGEGSDAKPAAKVLVKGSGKPATIPAMDQLVRLDGVEIRRIYRKPSGDIAEAAVHPDLAGVELVANFGSLAGSKRKRGIECFG